MFSFKDFITESIGSEEWNKSTLKAHLNDRHEHLKDKHEDIINHFHNKKKVDLIASSDALKIPVGSVKTIWNHLKDKRKESFGTSASKETKGEKLSRQLGQQKTVRREEFELDEVTKPKGIVDKKFGKSEAPSKSGFKTGQRVAHYRGMGKTLHGNVTNPDAVSGGTKGAMVKFEHGTEFIPHKELKDASEYWKSEDEKMRASRDKVKKEAFEQIDEVSAALANKVVQARQSRLNQMRKEKGDFGAAKTPEYKKELSKVQKSAPIAQKKSSDEIRKKVSSMTADERKRENDGYAKDADENRKRGWSNEEVEYS